MKILFINAVKKIDLNNSNYKNLERAIPSRIFIFYSIQHKELADKIKTKLEKDGKVVAGFEQVLGCVNKVPDEVILFIGEGNFHSNSILLKSKKQVFLFNGEVTLEINKEEKENMLKEEKVKLIKFLHSLNIGVLVSIKPGQYNLKTSLKFMDKLQGMFKGKKFYLFLADTIESENFDNFSIESWVNTACPGVGLYNKHVLNYPDLTKMKF